MSNIENGPEVNAESVRENTLSEAEIEKAVDESSNVFSLKGWVKQWGTRKQKERFSSQPKEKSAKQERWEREKSMVVEKYTGSIADRPRWCIWGKGEDGARGVLYWIKPAPDDHEAALRLASIITTLGGEARAEQTEWDGTFKGTPVYKKESALEPF